MNKTDNTEIKKTNDLREFKLELSQSLVRKDGGPEYEKRSYVVKGNDIDTIYKEAATSLLIFLSYWENGATYNQKEIQALLRKYNLARLSVEILNEETKS